MHKRKAIDLLRQDHKQLKDLFHKFNDADDPGKKQDIVETALIKLTVHSAIEEEIFYPAIQERMDERTLSLSEELEEEHHVMKILIVEMAQMDPNDGRYEAKFRVLADNVLDHMEKEETEIFSKLERSGANLNPITALMIDRHSSLLEEIFDTPAPNLEDKIGDLAELEWPLQHSSVSKNQKYKTISGSGKRGNTKLAV